MRGAFCHRCRTDLRQVLAIERGAADYRRRALAALEHGRRPDARSLACRACTLHRSRESVAVRAVIALADRDFPLALRLWREIRQGRETRPVRALARSGIRERLMNPCATTPHKADGFPPSRE